MVFLQQTPRENKGQSGWHYATYSRSNHCAYKLQKIFASHLNIIILLPNRLIMYEASKSKLILLITVLVGLTYHAEAFSVQFQRHSISLRNMNLSTRTTAYTSSPSTIYFNERSSSFKDYIRLQTSSSPSTEMDPVISETAVRLRRLNWFSWWSQVILTIVSSITLLFARSVLQVGKSNRSDLVTGGFFLAGSGIAASFLSIIWTWGGTRLSRRLLRKSEEYSRIKVASIIRRTVKIGVILNLFGMLFTLIGAEQIVGLLSAKILSAQGANPFSNNSQILGGQVTPLNALDILIVQANTNTLVSHFVSLLCTLLMTNSVTKLDPPSSDDDPR